MGKLERRSFLETMVWSAAALAAGPGRAYGGVADGPPNIVLILADDLGYGDPGCNNPTSKVPMPNVNAVAATGVRFTDAHSPSAVCTPTRYGILTGRYAWRTWLKRGVVGGYTPPLLEPGRVTVASLLKSRGYATGFFGKWHLGLGWTRVNGFTPTWQDAEKHLNKTSGGWMTPAGKPPVPGSPGQLYNLSKDPLEQNDLWEKHPEIVARLTALLDKYKRDGRSVPERRGE